MNERAVLDRIARAIERAGSLRKFAAEAGLSAAYVSRVVRGDLPPSSPRLCAAVGVERIVTVKYRQDPSVFLPKPNRRKS